MDSQITYKAPKDGEYAIIATCLGNGTGNFKLTMVEVSGTKNKVEAKTDKSVGAIFSKLDELSNDDDKDVKLTNSPCKKYTVKFAEGKIYQIDLKSKDFDAFLRLEDPTGKEVAYNDDAPGGSTLDSQIIYKAPKAGDFKIVATSLNGNTGTFKLTVAEATGAAGISKFKGKAIPLVLKNGKASHEGELDANDQVVTGRHFKIFTAKLDAGKTYQIDHRGGTPGFDAFLFLEDPDGKELAHDDDGGGDLNSRITYKINKTGNYRIIATTLPPNQEGKFTLEVVDTEAKDDSRRQDRNGVQLAGVSLERILQEQRPATSALRFVKE